MGLASPALQELILEVARRQFGLGGFRRRELMLEVEKELRARGLWSLDDDLPSGSKGKKSKGLANIDFRIIDLAKAGLLIKEARDRWRVSATPSDTIGEPTARVGRNKNVEGTRARSATSDLVIGSFLLTWNPRNWAWRELPDVVRRNRSGDPVTQRWSCGNARTIAPGSRVFLQRQGEEPKGIFASGLVTKSPFEAPHWDTDRTARGDKAFFIEFVVDSVLDPATSRPLDLRAFPSGPLTLVQIDAPASGNSIPEPSAVALEAAWAAHIGEKGLTLGLADPELGATEGEQRRRTVIHRSRERSLRDAKLAEARSWGPNGRLLCQVPGCGFDFEAEYGDVGAGYAQVHHLRPLAESSVPSFTRLSDLAVVCANCHAMIHRGGECRALESLRRKR